MKRFWNKQANKIPIKRSSLTGQLSCEPSYRHSIWIFPVPTTDLRSVQTLIRQRILFRRIRNSQRIDRLRSPSAPSARALTIRRDPSLPNHRYVGANHFRFVALKKLCQTCWRSRGKSWLRRWNEIIDTCLDQFWHCVYFSSSGQCYKTFQDTT